MLTKLFELILEEVLYPVETKQYLVNEKIKKVSIIRDEINFKNGVYELTIDQSIIIETDFHKYAMCRDAMISEFMKVEIDKDTDCVISEDTLKGFISSDETEKVRVTRKKIEL